MFTLLADAIEEPTHPSIADGSVCTASHAQHLGATQRRRLLQGALPPQAASERVHVAISTSSSHAAKARNETYFENAVVAALNWAHKGFAVLLLLVQDTDSANERARTIERAILEALERRRPGLIRTRIVKVNHSFAFVAQHCRLAAAHMFSLTDDAYLRLSDADMLCADVQRFRAFPGASAHVYNGGCCGKHQYPMHSMGMRAGLWKAITHVDLCAAPTSARWQVGPPIGACHKVRCQCTVVQRPEVPESNCRWVRAQQELPPEKG